MTNPLANSSSVGSHNPLQRVRSQAPVNDAYALPPVYDHMLTAQLGRPRTLRAGARANQRTTPQLTWGQGAEESKSFGRAPASSDTGSRHWLRSGPHGAWPLRGPRMHAATWPSGPMGAASKHTHEHTYTHTLSFSVHKWACFEPFEAGAAGGHGAKGCHRLGLRVPAAVHRSPLSRALHFGLELHGCVGVGCRPLHPWH